MSIDEGYVKYRSHWTPGPAPDPELALQLERWRRPLFEAGLVGHYDSLGVGYGNISIRSRLPGQFLISGTQTGHLAETGIEHYALVTDYSIENNMVACSGPVQASSEAMTHAAIYELDRRIAAIVHVHSAALWNKYLDELPTTSAAVAYGTPAMAMEFQRLYAETDFAESGLAVMAGHEEGLISCATTLAIATTRMLDLARTSDHD